MSGNYQNKINILNFFKKRKLCLKTSREREHGQDKILHFEIAVNQQLLPIIAKQIDGYKSGKLLLQSIEIICLIRQLPPVAINGNLTGRTQGKYTQRKEQRCSQLGRGFFLQMVRFQPQENCLVPKCIILEYSTSLKAERRFKTRKLNHSRHCSYVYNV